MKLITSLLLVSLLTGCGFSFGLKKPEAIEVKKVAVEKSKLELEDPAPIPMKQFRWIIVTRDNAETVFTQLEEQKKDVVLFGLTDDDYETLSVNIFNLRTYIEKQKDVTNKYRDYYEPKVNK